MLLHNKNSKVIIKIIILILLVFVFYSFDTTNSTKAVDVNSTIQTTVQTDVNSTAGELGYNVNSENRSIVSIIISIASYALSFLGILFLILMIYNGIIWMTAEGDEQKVEKSKATIKNAVLGIVAVMLAYALTKFIISPLVS